jgi:hypothetical protein
MSEDRDQRGDDIGVNRCRIITISPVQLSCSLLDSRIIAKFTLCADQFTPQLFRQLTLAASRCPTKVCYGRTDPASYKRFKRRSIPAVMIRFRNEKESSNTAQTFLSRSVVKRTVRSR